VSVIQEETEEAEKDEEFSQDGLHPKKKSS